MNTWFSAGTSVEKAVEPLGNGALLEDMNHRVQTFEGVLAQLYFLVTFCFLTIYAMYQLLLVPAAMPFPP